MKRQNPLLSSFGFLFAAILLGGLALDLWISGGMAFNPGLVSSHNNSGRPTSEFGSHAEFESDCTRCHAPLETNQAGLCVDCHTRVKLQIETAQGTHGLTEQVADCRTCHREHLGREYKLIEDNLPGFKHALTGFSLVWHQLDYDTSPISCRGCHNFEVSVLAQAERCSICHARADFDFMVTHRRQYGESCTACHDGQDRMLTFDHQTTEFPLTGQHAALACNACHELQPEVPGPERNAQIQSGKSGLAARLIRTEPDPQQPPDPLELFKQTPTECQGCHSEPDRHLGFFQTDCAACHSTQTWSPARIEGDARWSQTDFSHQEHARFSLQLHQQDYDGSLLSCAGCHTADTYQFAGQACIDCHSIPPEGAAFMAEHTAEVGNSCLDCHDGEGSMQGFDHQSVFALNGRHAGIACQDCHIDFNFQNTSTECAVCHAEPAIHAGSFGLECQYCHTDQGWLPAQLRQHVFPLDHGDQGVIACQTCHVTRYDAYTCYGCHDHQEEAIQASHIEAGIPLEKLPDCAICHPAGVLEAAQLMN